MNLQILKKPFLAISCLLLLCLIFSCGKQKNETIKTLRTCIRSSPYTLKPYEIFDGLSHRIAYSLFEGLTRIGLDHQIHLGIADTIEISSDKKTYTITLKKTLWSTGEPLLAQDFVYSWQKSIAKESNAQLSNLFYCIRNTKEVKEGKLPLEQAGIHVIDDYTLQIELAHPTPYFLHLLANPIFAPVCRKIDEKDPFWAQKESNHFVCNGPFKLKVQNENCLILEKNAFYYDANVVQLDEIHLFVVTDANTCYLMYETGEIDWYGDMFAGIGTEAIISSLKNETVELMPLAATNWLFCNTKKFPLHSKKIRQAISAVIERQNYVDHIAVGDKPATSLLPNMLTNLKEEDMLQEKDIVEAQALFQEGLNDLNIRQDQFPRLTFTYSITHPWGKPFLQYLQQRLQNVLGIQSTLESCEFNVLLDRLKQADYELAPIGWVSYIPDPIYFLEAFEIDSSNNFSYCEYPKCQQFIDKAEKEGDEKLRIEYLRQAEKILIEELPVIPLSYRQTKILNRNLKNVVITELGEVDFKWASLKPNL